MRSFRRSGGAIRDAAASIGSSNSGGIGMFEEIDCGGKGISIAYVSLEFHILRMDCMACAAAARSMIERVTVTMAR